MFCIILTILVTNVNIHDLIRLFSVYIHIYLFID